MNFALRLAPALLAVALVAAATPAQAQETRIVVLDPQKHSDAHKAIAGAQFFAIKAEKEASVVIVETSSSSAVRVMSGTITVRNLTDKSVVKLTEGCAYETDTHTDTNHRQPEAFINQAADTIALFESKSNTSYLYRMENSKRLKAEILSPPLNQTYSIGDVARARLPMSPTVTTNFPPAGVVVWHPPTPALAEQGNAQ